MEITTTTGMAISSLYEAYFRLPNILIQLTPLPIYFREALHSVDK